MKTEWIDVGGSIIKVGDSISFEEDKWTVLAVGLPPMGTGQLARCRSTLQGDRDFVITSPKATIGEEVDMMAYVKRMNAEHLRHAAWLLSLDAEVVSPDGPE